MKGRDSSGHPFLEIPTLAGEKLRVTYIPAKATGYPSEPSLRVQVREASGQLRQGPEFPIRILNEVVGAMIELALNLI